MPETQVWVGLDAGIETTSACIVDEAGRIVARDVIPSDAQKLSAYLRSHAEGRVARVGVEACAIGTFLTRGLRKDGWTVSLYDARKVRKFLVIRQNKTDANDAYGIAEVARLGGDLLNEVYLKSVECEQIRLQLSMRHRLVGQRLAADGMLRSMFQVHGIKLKRSQSAATLRRNVSAALAQITEGRGDMETQVSPLLALCEGLRLYLADVEKRLAQKAEEIPACRRFMRIPGVGPICALSFYSAVEDPHRFARNTSIGPYLGLTPRISRSGETVRRSGISKMGNRLTRTHLVKSAICIMGTVKEDSAIKRWAESLTARIGRPRARVALARKLATIMVSIWKTETDYIAHPSKAMVS